MLGLGLNLNRKGRACRFAIKGPIHIHSRAREAISLRRHIYGRERSIMSGLIFSVEQRVCYAIVLGTAWFSASAMGGILDGQQLSLEV